jgi:hypothetical protein
MSIGSPPALCATEDGALNERYLRLLGDDDGRPVCSNGCLPTPHRPSQAGVGVPDPLASQAQRPCPRFEPGVIDWPAHVRGLSNADQTDSCLDSTAPLQSGGAADAVGSRWDALFRPCGPSEKDWLRIHHLLAVQRGLLRITGNSGAAILTSLSHLPRKPSLHLHTRAVLLGDSDRRSFAPSGIKGESRVVSPSSIAT